MFSFFFSFPSLENPVYFTMFTAQGVEMNSPSYLREMKQKLHNLRFEPGSPKTFLTIEKPLKSVSQSLNCIQFGDSVSVGNVEYPLVVIATRSTVTQIGFVWFYDISTTVGYLMPNPFYSYEQFYFKQFSLA